MFFWLLIGTLNSELRYAAKLTYLDATTGRWQTLEASDWVGLWACNVTHMTQTVTLTLTLTRTPTLTLTLTLTPNLTLTLTLTP